MDRERERKENLMEWNGIITIMKRVLISKHEISFIKYSLH